MRLPERNERWDPEKRLKWGLDTMLGLLEASLAWQLILRPPEVEQRNYLAFMQVAVVAAANKPINADSKKTPFVPCYAF
jgi:hypothetical protein